MKSEHENDAHTEPKKASRGSLRACTGLLLGLLTFVYVAGIVSGYIPAERRIDGVSLGVIALGTIGIAVLVRPELFDRLKRLEMSGFKLEMLERVKERQAKQEIELEDMSLMLPLLLPQTERKHLVNLSSGRATEYKGNHVLRNELRRLRSLGLITMRPDRHVGELKDKTTFDLAHYVELTDLGKRWVRRIMEIERAESMGETGVEEQDPTGS